MAAKHRTTVYVPRELVRAARDKGISLTSLMEASLKEVLELPEDGLVKLDAEIRKCETRTAALRVEREKLMEKHMREEITRHELLDKLRPYREYYSKNRYSWHRTKYKTREKYLEETAANLGMSVEELEKHLEEVKRP